MQKKTRHEGNKNATPSEILLDFLNFYHISKRWRLQKRRWPFPTKKWDAIFNDVLWDIRHYDQAQSWIITGRPTFAWMNRFPLSETFLALAGHWSLEKNKRDFRVKAEPRKFIWISTLEDFTHKLKSKALKEELSCIFNLNGHSWRFHPHIKT